MKVLALPGPSPSRGRFLARGAASGRAARAPGRGAPTMAAAPALAGVPARQHYRVQLRFVTEEQLFSTGPLLLSNPTTLRLEVHPAGEEADATVTDGKVLGRPTHASPAQEWQPLGRATVEQRGEGACLPGACLGPRGALLVTLSI